MKKIFALLSAGLIVASMLVACGPATKTTTCEMCGKENVKCKEIKYEGETGWFCEATCYDAMQELIKVADSLK